MKLLFLVAPLVTLEEGSERFEAAQVGPFAIAIGATEAAH